MLVLYLGVGVGLLIGIIHLYIYLMRRRYRHFKQLPILPGLWWIPGHGPLFKDPEYGYYGNDPNLKKPQPNVVTAGMTMVRKLNYNTVAFFIWEKCFVFSLDIDIASITLSSKDFRKLGNPRVTEPNGTSVFGKKGILTEPGTQIWTHKRKTMDPAFQKKFLRNLTSDMNMMAGRLCEHLETMPNTNRIEIYDVFMKAALEVVCRCGFNLDDKVIEADNSPINTAVNDIFSCVQDAFSVGNSYALPWVLRQSKDLLKKQVDYINEYLSGHLRDRLDLIQAGKDDKNDILSFIISANMFDNKIVMGDVLNDFLTFLSAGMETTAITMSILLWYMVKNPEVYRKAKQEVEAVFGERDELEYDDLNQLVYLEMCIKETLRIAPPVGATSRTNLRPITMKGLYFPRRTWIFIPEKGIHHRADIWPEPDKFDPERFDPKKKIAPFTFIPFTAGPRICIGKHFAMMEMKILISRLIKEFHIFDADPGNDKLVKVLSLTEKPKNGVYVGLTK